MKNISAVLSLIIFVFFLAGCEGGTKNLNDDESSDQKISDTDSDESADLDKESENDTIPDDDEVKLLTLKCPASVDEETEVICDIESEYSSFIRDGDDSCFGEIFESEGRYFYKFTPSEQMGPGTCLVKVRETTVGEDDDALIEINEVNQSPFFNSDDFTITFSENYNSSKDFFAYDNDYPKQSESDPGFINCLIIENECGNWVTVEKDDNKCVVSGTMPEELTDGTCKFKLVVKDGYGAEVFETVTATLVEKNEEPVWVTSPSNINVIAGDSYNEINSVATDSDIPNDSEGDPGYLTCVSGYNSCSFDVSIQSDRDETGKTSCRVVFTAGNLVEECNLTYQVTDGTKSIQSEAVKINVSASVEIDCPESVNEGEEIVCDITSKGGDPVVLDWFTNTCHGEISNESGQWKYRYLTTEIDGPEFCDAAVGIGTVTAITTVEIKEVNTTPELGFSGGCADPDNAAATEGQDFFCNVSKSDADRPNIDPGDPGYITCEIKNNTCASWLSFDSNCNGSGKPDEESGGTECSYVVEVTDGYGAKVSKNVSITISEVNSYPSITVEPPSSKVLMTNETITFTYSATDSDIPNSSDGDPGFLKCSASTTGINSQVTSTGEGSGAVTCSVEIKASAVEECLSGCSVTFSVEDGYGLKDNAYMSLFVKKCVFYVGEYGSGSAGRSWGDAFVTVQDAVDESWYGCEIWVKQGTYTNPANDKSPVLTMKDGVKIIGGFGGYEDPKHEVVEWRTRPKPLVHSVLDGESSSYHVVVGALNNAMLDGFVITSGNADGENEEDQLGGGMYNKASSNSFSEPFVQHCIFIDNFAKLGGGALFNEGFSQSVTEFNNVQFINNGTDGYGGAVWNRNTSKTRYVECEFTNNTANYGGAIFEYSSPSTIDKCTFIENQAVPSAESGGNGGAIFVSYESPLNIVNSVFLKNSAKIGGGIDGGGMDENDVTIDHSTFSRNTGLYNTGGLFIDGTVTNSIFWESSVDLTRTITVNYSFGTGDTTGIGNINSIAPGSDMFINDKENLMLDPSSPAIDSADPASTVTHDIKGSARPSGTVRDMGALEFQQVEADLYVDCGVPSTGDGMSWSSPFKTFHQAVGQLELSGGGIIFVKGGNCKYSEVGMSAGYIVRISNGIKIYGGFTGTETFLRDRSDPSANPTILDGEKSAVTAITVTGGTNIVIDGFVVQNAYNGGFSGPLNEGSGVYNTVFKGNKASSGGAMNITNTPYHTAPSSKIVNTVFINNQASDGLGGAIYLSGSGATNIDIYNCVFIYNSVNRIAEGDTAVSIADSVAYFDIKNSIFHQNRSHRNYAVGQVDGATSENLTYSINDDADPGLVNIPDLFWIAFDDGTMSRVDTYNTLPGVTTSHLLEINNDGVLRTIDSMIGDVINFSPALSEITKRGDLLHFWPAGTTDSEIDLHLKSDSACRNSGTYVEDSIRDYSGKRRFYSTDPEIFFDIGVYEY